MMISMFKISLTLALVLSVPSSGRPAFSPVIPQTSQSVYIAEGIGIDGVVVGHSTMNSVVARYGEGFVLVEHNKYSYEVAYDDLGLSFWYRYGDPEKKIFSIGIKPPCRAFTARGISLGKSTLQDVFNAYGKAGFRTTSAERTWFFEYPGIEFHVSYKPEDGTSRSLKGLLKRKVIEIDIVAVESKP